ncbi:hypothetical protein COU76_02200 [Candidatus Peregrinibacteria bacterium CG10_big_fil_rev_8_21_14_0_10_49_10]|nr:MAG: hypothetical protein COU76_02200 [Candidatus Peregrinibacteria bacterium CG10_big_fil_rev_8_21_14_0_10_49_10]
MRKAVQRSSRIIAVSSFTAEEVRRTYGEHIAEKTTVIQEAVSSQFTPRSTEEQEAVRSRYHLPKTFLLYVGNAKQHKNLPVLLAAFRQAQLQETALVLVTGEKEASRLHTGTNVQRIESVREEDLPALYSASRAFVTASLYEGFCFPLLEAAACGCPVLAVNGSAIAEVAPPGAVLVEPMVASFAAAFKHLPAPAPSPSLHSRTWKHVAEETLSVLRK